MYGRATVEYIFETLANKIERVFWIDANNNWHEGVIISKAINIDDVNMIGELKIYAIINGNAEITKVVFRDYQNHDLIWSNASGIIENQVLIIFVLTMNFSVLTSNGGGDGTPQFG